MNEVLVYTALDHNERKGNLKLATTLTRVPGDHGFKINLDHIMLWGVDYVRRVVEKGRPVFADLKMKNGSRTMRNLADVLVTAGVRHISVYADAERLIRPLAESMKGSYADLLGVTVLTHYDEAYCHLLYKRSLGETVKVMATLALNNGCKGIILPGTALEFVRNIHRPKLVPAVYPDWYVDRQDNNQEQTVQPIEAVAAGADILVCGSPIRKSSNPTESLVRVLEEVRSASK